MTTENLFEEGKVRLYSGKYVKLTELTEDDICLEDVAHALAMKCRWNGNSSGFFSILSHTLLVQFLLDDKNNNTLQALLHDAHEAYLFDIPAPVKTLEPFIPLVKLEKDIQSIINRKYGIDTCDTVDVKRADTDALRLEWNSCVLNNGAEELNSLLRINTLEEAKRKFFYYFSLAYSVQVPEGQKSKSVNRELSYLSTKYKI